jgi:hypothetical protein
MSSFSPLLVSKLVILPLRYFFSNYAKAYDLVWDEDEKIRTIEVGHMNDYHQIAIQKNPRVLISRGDYQINKVGITDNLAEALPSQLHGSDDRVNMVLISGNAQIIIEARQQGTCEILADMVSHFITWSRPFLCDTQGFKEFGLPMVVSDCTPDQEDKEKFKVVISIPFMMEEKWTVRQEALSLKSFFVSLSKQP